MLRQYENKSSISSSLFTLFDDGQKFNPFSNNLISSFVRLELYILWTMSLDWRFFFLTMDDSLFFLVFSFIWLLWFELDFEVAMSESAENRFDVRTSDLFSFCRVEELEELLRSVTILQMKYLKKSEKK